MSGSRSAARRAVSPLRRQAMIASGWFALALGVLIWPLPGPGGLPVMLVGLGLILGHSAPARRRFVRLQRRYPKMLGPIRRLLGRRRRKRAGQVV